jgi:cell division protein FtsQ
MSTVTPVEDDEEPDARPDKRKVALIVVAATVVVAVAVVWIVAFSPVFGVRKVEVRGTERLSATEVEAAADISHGTPLVRLDTAAITRRVDQLAEVASAQVSTAFPSTVTITIVEREPVGYVKDGSRIMLVDRTGDQYQQVKSAPAGLPLFRVPAGSSARTTGGAVATVAAALPASLRKIVTSIDALDPRAITLLLTRDRVVQWGSATENAQKAQVILPLVHRGADSIDVTDPNQPYTH